LRIIFHVLVFLSRVIDIMSLTLTKGVKVRIVGGHHAGKTGTVVKVTEKMCSIWVGLQSDPIRVMLFNVEIDNSGDNAEALETVTTELHMLICSLSGVG
jgi:hypothetical protein